MMKKSKTTIKKKAQSRPAGTPVSSASPEKNQSFKKLFENFQKTVESKIGKVNWKKVGIYTIALMLFVAAKGFMGPKAQIAALAIIKVAAHTV